ncbi:MAG: glycosyltransferase family 2 protein [Prevotella sp.]|nr:glycosyltransferase family 2 protein [Prevotella sp.]
MKLSVVIPVYRVEDTLDRCVESIVSQSFRELEIILVDDGSPDSCPQLCEEWARRDDRIIVVHKQNGGLSDARNAGIEVAKGERITFVDSDDFVDVNTFEQLMPLVAQADVVEYPIYWHYGAAEQRVCQFGNHTYTHMADYWLKGYAYGHTYACNKIFRRSLFSDVRFPKGKVFEDAWTLPLLLKKAQRVVTSDQGLYYYCQNSQGITAQADGHALQMLLDAHLQVMQDPALASDPRYYMHILNIQLDVCTLTGQKPTLPAQTISPFTHGLSPKLRAKALILNLLGIERLCQINKLIRQMRR